MIKCDLCDKPAVVHEVTIKGGVKKEVHLCSEHAQTAGIPLPGHQPINQLLSQFVVSKGEKTSSSTVAGRRASRLVCGSCGLSFAEFRQRGVVGCPDCYDAFENQLEAMIERAQNGGTTHCGKCPQRGGKSIDRQLQIQRLVRELEDAVAAEQYERAAELRDQLRSVESTAPGVESPRPARDEV